jgi:hypothetical protein
MGEIGWLSYFSFLVLGGSRSKLINGWVTTTLHLARTVVSAVDIKYNLLAVHHMGQPVCKRHSVHFRPVKSVCRNNAVARAGVDKGREIFRPLRAREHFVNCDRKMRRQSQIRKTRTRTRTRSNPPLTQALNVTLNLTLTLTL